MIRLVRPEQDYILGPHDRRDAFGSDVEWQWMAEADIPAEINDGMKCPARQLRQSNQRLNVTFVLCQRILEFVNLAAVDLLPALIPGCSENDAVTILGLNDKDSKLRNDDVIDLCGFPFAVGNDHVINTPVTARIKILRQSPCRGFLTQPALELIIHLQEHQFSARRC